MHSVVRWLTVYIILYCRLLYWDYSVKALANARILFAVVVGFCMYYSLVLFCDARKWIFHFSLNLRVCVHIRNSEQFRIYGNAFVSCFISLLRFTFFKLQSFVLCTHIFHSRLKRREVQGMNFKMYFH